MTDHINHQHFNPLYRNINKDKHQQITYGQDIVFHALKHQLNDFIHRKISLIE